MTDDQIGHFLQCRVRRSFGDAFVDQIRPVERLNEQFALVDVNSHLLQNILLYTRRGRGREKNDVDAWISRS